MNPPQPTPKKPRRWVRWLVALLVAVASYCLTCLLLANTLTMTGSYSAPPSNLPNEEWEAEWDRCERTMTYRVEFFGMVVEEGNNRDGRFRYDRKRGEFDKFESLRTTCLSVIFLAPLLQAILVGFGVSTFWWLASKRRAE